MKKRDIKKGQAVVDRWDDELGVGTITELNTRTFKVQFNDKLYTYDYAHAYFLNTATKSQ